VRERQRKKGIRHREPPTTMGMVSESAGEGKALEHEQDLCPGKNGCEYVRSGKDSILTLHFYTG